MQLTKIISGGRDGADQAALDAAIELGIDHGGWASRETLSEDGSLSEKYHLQGMPTASDAQRDEKNVLDSDGTVVFTRGPLSGGAKLTADLTTTHGRPLLHIDLRRAHALKASTDLHEWIVKERVRVLNVVGPTSSTDPGIYHDVYQAIWGLFTLDVMGAQHGPDAGTFRLADMARKIASWPETVEEAVAFLERHLPLEHRVMLSRADEQERAAISLRMGAWVRETFGLWQGNDPLQKSVEAWSGRPIGSADDASTVILDVLAERLQKTHRLRVVK